MKINASLETRKVLVEGIQRCFCMDIQRFEKDSPKLTHHIIELDITISPTHQVRYRLNPNYVTTIKQNIDKLLAIGFIEYVEEATWLSPIVIVPKKNGKLRICIYFRNLNVTTRRIHTHYLSQMKC